MPSPKQPPNAIDQTHERATNLWGWVIGTSGLALVLGMIEAIAPNLIITNFNATLANIVALLEAVLFVDIFGIPLVVLWLSLGAIFLTLRLGFVNFWGLRHGLQVLMHPEVSADQPGEVTSFQALSTALAATVGLGNISGVAIAIQLGGPGAVFWMTLAALLGMSSKFVESTLVGTNLSIDFARWTYSRRADVLPA